MPLDQKKVRSKAANRGIPEESLGQVRWEAFDWVDQAGAEATGTRIRLWFPRNFLALKSNELPLDPPSGSRLIPFWQIVAFIEPQLFGTEQRAFTLVQGIHVDDDRLRSYQLALGKLPRYGVWIDLRGAAAPQLTVSRAGVLQLYNQSNGMQGAIKVMQGIWDRWTRDLFRQATAERDCVRNLLLLSLGAEQRLFYSKTLKTSAALIPDSLVSRENLTLLVCSFISDLPSAYLRSHNAAADIIRANQSLARGSSLDLPIGDIFDQTRYLLKAVGTAQALTLSNRGGLLSTEQLSTEARVPERSFQAVDHHLLTQIQGELLQDAFSEDLARSCLSLDLFSFEGRIGDCVLTAPARFHFELVGNRIEFSDPEGNEPVELVSLGYDLCIPMTSIPLGRLRAEFPPWRQHPKFRRMATFPLIWPSTPHMRASREDLQDSGIPNELYAFSPTFDLWFKPFSEWTRADWQHPDNRSYLWNNCTGEILVVRGSMRRTQMKKKSQPSLKYIMSIKN